MTRRNAPALVVTERERERSPDMEDERMRSMTPAKPKVIRNGKEE